MRITFYVNTMVLLESEHTRVLCDPWVTFDARSDSGFYNFPYCHLTRDDVRAVAPHYIYISHTHPDHFDPQTLKLFDSATPILVSHYAFNFTERAVRNLGFTDVRVVPPTKGLALNGDDFCWIEPSAANPEVDSIALFRLDGETAVNANDNVFHHQQCVDLRRRAGGIDIGLLPSAAHGPWPMFFENYTANEKSELSAMRAEKIKAAFVDYVRAFAPRHVVPIAGGIIAAGDKVHQYCYSGIRPRSEVVADARRIVDFEPVLLSEGCMYNSRTQEHVGTYRETTYELEGAYLERLSRTSSLFSREGQFFVAPSQRIDLTRLLMAARVMQKRAQDRANIVSSMVFFFDVGEEKLYRLSLAGTDVTRVKEQEIADERYEIYRLPYELLLGMLTRHYIWSNVNTQHMTFFRKGEGLDLDLSFLLNFLQV